MVPTRRAERDHRTSVEIGRDQKKLVRQFAEIVGPRARLEQLREIVGDAPVVEQSGRQRARQLPERFEEAVRDRIFQILPRRRGQQVRHPCEAAGIFAQRRTQQEIGLERIIGRVALDEHFVHLTRGDAVGEARREEAAGADPHINVAGRQIDAVERLTERDQSADFINAAQRPAACERHRPAKMRHLHPPSSANGRLPTWSPYVGLDTAA